METTWPVPHQQTDLQVFNPASSLYACWFNFRLPDTSPLTQTENLSGYKSGRPCMCIWSYL